MINVDLNGRLSFPTTVGSSSREGRLHHLMDQTLSTRRSSLRDSNHLPKLSKNFNATKSIPNLTQEGDDHRLGGGRPSKRAAVKIRKASTGETMLVPTSVSCPAGFGGDETEGSGRSYRTRVDMRLSLGDRNRLPSTTNSNPRMNRQRQRSVVVSLERLPPVIGEEDGPRSQDNTNKENLTSRLPRVGETTAAAVKSSKKNKMDKMGLGKVHRKPSSKASETDNPGTKGKGQNQEEGDKPEEDALLGASPHQGASSSKTRSLQRSSTNINDGEGTDAEISAPPAAQSGRRVRKISQGLKRTQTVGALPIGGTEKHHAPRSSRRGTVPTSKQEWYIPRFLHKGEALGLFRRSVRKVSLVLSWFKSLAKKNDSTDQALKSFLDMAKEIEESTNQHDIEERSGLTFDPKVYCAQKEVQLSEEARTILTTPARDRTPEMIQKVLPVLQNQKAFAEYPLHMQQKFARVAWFQQVPPKRMILKQGHYAENFYFILAGKAIVKLITKDGNGELCMRAVARMQSGQSFGEVALLQQSVRTATVESATQMDILVITREDFQRIFFNTSDGQDPEHITFCKKQITFLSDFPIDLSMQTPGTCLFHFFRPGAVVVADSKKSEWIYLVKSGSCQVLKRLDAVNPRRPWANKKLDLRIKLPRNGTAEPGPRIDTRLRLDDTYKEPLDDTSDDDFSSCDEEFQKFEDEKEEEEEQDAGEGERVRVTRFTLPARPVTCATNTEKAMPPIREDAETPSEGRENKKRKSPPKSAPTLAPTPTKSPRIGRTLAQPGYSKSKLFFLPEIKKAYIDNELDMPVMPASWAYLDDDEDDRLTLADAMTIDARSTKSVRHVKPPPPSKPPCFVQLGVLRPRDAFGLDMVKFDDDQGYDTSANTSVTLVSNGCELIMLSRRFFERHATELSKQHIREKVRPFPPDDTLQHNLQIEVNWDLFRKDTVGDFLDLIRQTSELDNSR